MILFPRNRSTVSQCTSLQNLSCRACLLLCKIIFCMPLFDQQFLLYLLSFVETPRKFIIAELSIRKLGSSSVLIILLIIVLLALMKIRAYGSKALQ